MRQSFFESWYFLCTQKAVKKTPASAFSQLLTLLTLSSIAPPASPHPARAVTGLSLIERRLDPCLLPVDRSDPFNKSVNGLIPDK